MITIHHSPFTIHHSPFTIIHQLSCHSNAFISAVTSTFSGPDSSLTIPIGLAQLITRWGLSLLQEVSYLPVQNTQ